MEGPQFALPGEGAGEGFIVIFEMFGTLNAAVKRDSVTDGVLFHCLPQSDERGEHVGFDILGPLALVGFHKDVLADEFRHFIARDEDGHDLVVAKYRRSILQRPLEA